MLPLNFYSLSRLNFFLLQFAAFYNVVNICFRLYCWKCLRISFRLTMLNAAAKSENLIGRELVGQMTHLVCNFSCYRNIFLLIHFYRSLLFKPQIFKVDLLKPKLFRHLHYYISYYWSPPPHNLILQVYSLL